MGVAAVAHGGQRANQETHKHIEQAGEPEPAHVGDGACLGAQVLGSPLLQVLHAVGQHIGQLGRQLAAQVEQGLGHRYQHLAVLLRRVQQIALRVDQADGHEHHGHHQHDGHGQVFHPQRGRGVQRCRHAAELTDLVHQKQREGVAGACGQQAHQQAIEHDQQQGGGHQHIGGHPDAPVRRRRPPNMRQVRSATGRLAGAVGRGLCRIRLHRRPSI